MKLFFNSFLFYSNLIYSQLYRRIVVVLFFLLLGIPLAQASYIPFNTSAVGNIGIGTSTPQAKFVVLSGNVGIGTWTAAGGSLIVRGGGNVGIGSAWPGAALDVQGTVRASFFTMSGQTPIAGYVLTASDSAGDTTWQSASAVGGWTVSGNNVFETGSGNVGIGTSALQTALAITNGNVGIGTWTASVALDVNGSVRMTGFILNNSPVAGDILMTNAVGIGTWVAASSVATPTPPNGVGTELQFRNGTSFGAVTNSAVNANGNVGLGTILSANKLDVQGGVGIGTAYAGYITAPSNGLIVQGNVGIGSTVPGQKLDVQGTVRTTFFTMSGQTPVSGYVLTASDSAGDTTWTSAGAESGWTVSGNNVYETSSGNVGIGTSALQTALAITNGNVGIGTWTASNNLLSVAGGVGIGATYTANYSAPSNGLLVQGNVGISTWALGSSFNVQGNSVLGSVNNTNSVLSSTGTGSLAGGDAESNGYPGSITSSSPGSFAFGYGRAIGGAGGPGYIVSNGGGAVAMGEAFIGTIQSGGSGSVAMGYSHGNGSFISMLEATGNGSVAMGYVDYVSGPANGLESTGNGSVAMGYANSQTLEATGDGSVAIGDSVEATATDAEAFGLNVINNTANTFMVGFNTTPTLTVTSANVGIGTSSPFGGRLIVASGNVGIGSLTPGQVLDVQGTVRTTGFTMSGQTPVSGYVLTASDSAGDTTWTSASSVSGWTVSGNNVYETSSGNVGIGTSALQTALAITNGNVGIGTWTAAVALDVNGSVRMTGFILNNSPVAGDILMTNGIGIGTWVAASSVATPTPPNGVGTELQFRNGTSFGAVTNSAVNVSGNVGLGTILSANKLDVQGGVGIGTAYAGYFTAPANGLIVQGNVGVGSTAPGQKLDVTGTVRTTFFTMSGQTPIAGYVLTASDSAGDTTWQSASAVGGWTVSGNNVFETDNGNVGIGTTTPQGSLVVTNGNVGIGTWAPGGELIVMGGSVGIGTNLPQNQNSVANLLVLQSSANSGMSILSSAGTSSADVVFGNPTTPVNGMIQYNNGNNFMSFRTNGNQVTNSMVMDNNGNIGIGTQLPLNRLSVAGNIGIGTNSNSIYINTAAPKGGIIVEGNVGIGSLTPGQLLDVQGTVRTTFFAMSGQTPIAGYVLTASDSAGDTTWQSASAVGGWTVSGNNVFETNNGNVGIGTSALQTALAITNGNVGIGTWTAAVALDVNGSVRMTGFILNSSPVAGDILMTNGIGIGTWVAASSVATPTPPNGVGTELQFRNGTSFGAVTNSAVNVSGNVGLGTILSANKLDVQGGVGIGTSYAGYFAAPANGLIVQGNVGVGSTAPGQKFDVQGTVRTTFLTMSGQTPIAGYVLTASDSAGDTTWQSASAVGGWTVSGNNVYETNSGNVGIGTSALQTALAITNGNVGIGTWTAAGGSLIVASGNVGIGSAWPGAVLDVNGTARFLTGIEQGGTVASGTNSTALGYLFGGGTITSSGFGSFAGGQSNNAGGTSSIISNGSSFAFGVAAATSSTASISSTSSGSIALGYASATGTPTSVSSSALGSFAMGDAFNGTILSNNGGSIAMGYSNGVLQANGTGSIAMGNANSGTLQATGNASVAMGFASIGTLQATGLASFAMGQNVQANANNAFALGSSVVNPNASSFMVGFNPTPTLTVTGTGVGIGTSSPFGGGLIVLPANTGNVGIGSLTPGQALDVTGTVRTTSFTMSGQTPVSGYVLTASDSAGDTTWTSAGVAGGWTVTGNNVYETNSGNVGIGTSALQTALAITNGNVGIGTWTAAGGNLIVNGGGNVGIGTAWPGALLDVNGTARFLTNIEQGGTLASGSLNAMALGYVQGGGTITSSGEGSLSGGTSVLSGGTSSAILANGTSSFAYGYSLSTLPSPSLISSTGSGSVAMGEVFNGTILSSGGGSIAMGIAAGSILQATQQGSVAIGDSVQATAQDAEAFGLSFVNNSPSTFMVGFGAGPTLTVTSTNVGIGTILPSAKLSVVGNIGIGASVGSSFITTSPPNGGMIVQNNVGIGSLTPGQALDVNGTVRTTSFTMSGQTPVSGYVLTASDSAGDTTWTSAGSVGGWTVTGNNVYETNSGNVGIGTSALQTALAITNGNVGIGTWTAAGGALIVENGNVGFGTYAPSALLTVNGDSIIGFVNSSTDSISASGTGVLAGGEAAHSSNAGSIASSGFGSLAFGDALGNASGNGSIISNSNGSVALGDASGGTIISSGPGTFAMGEAQGGTILANGSGSIAIGYSDTILQATGNTSVAIGQDVQATAGNTFALGQNVINGYTGSFMVGFNTTPTLTVRGTGVGIGTLNPFGGGLIVIPATTGNVGIGSLTPGQALDINGTARMTGFTLSNNGAGAGYVMVGNGVGIGTWMAASTLPGTGTTPGGGQAAIQYNNSSSFAGDATKFSFDGTNIGIGTAGPLNKLSIVGNIGIGTVSYSPFVTTAAPNGGALFEGNVGIATINPAARLQINSDLTLHPAIEVYDTFGGLPWLAFQIANEKFIYSPAVGTNGPVINFGNGATLSNNGGDFFRINPQAVNSGNLLDVISGTSSTAVTVIDMNGNVGIGTASAVNKLAVNGNVGIGTNINSPYLTTTAPNGGMIVQGNVGLGSLAPGMQLDVSGTVRTTGFTMSGQTPISGYVLTASDSAGDTTWSSPGSVGGWTVSGNNVYETNSGNVGIGTSALQTALAITNGNVGIGTWTAAGGALIVESGNVGIGTVTPGTMLDVGGVVRGDGFSEMGTTGGGAGETSLGSVAGGGTITASNIGALAGGFSEQGPGTISASILANSNPGSFAYGWSQALGAGNSSIISSTGQGSVAMGNALNGTLSATGEGAIAMGFASQTLQATGGGSVAMGENVQANASNTFALGSSVVNGYAGSFMVGFNAIPTLTVTGTNVGIGTLNPFGGGLIVTNGNVGIGSLAPGQILDVQGTARMTGFTLSNNGAAAGNILVTNGVGVGTWMAASTLPISSSGSSQWITTTGVGIGTYSNVGIGTVTPQAGLVVTNGNVGIGTWTAAGGALIVENGNVGIGTYAPSSLFTVQGSTVLGDVVSSTDSITTSGGSGALAGGSAQHIAGGTTGTITSSGTGSLAFGEALGWGGGGGNASIISNGNGAIALGYAQPGGILQSSGPGSIAMGAVDQGTLLASSVGSIAMGEVSAGGTLQSNNSGIAMGVASGGTLQASGLASFAMGQNVQANAANAFALGLNVVNPNASSLMVGFNATPTLTVTGTGVGIGTSSPFGGGLIVLPAASGNVGIGSLTPGQALDVQGTVRTQFFAMSGQTPVSGYVLTASDSAGDTTWTSAGVAGGWTVTGNNVYETSSGNVGIGTSALQTALAITNGNVGIGTWTAAGGNLIVNGGGNVGIGSAWPGVTLDVNGTIRSTAIGTSDFVSNVGIGSLTPGTALDVQGMIRTTAFELNNSPVSGDILMTNGVGVGTWIPVSAVGTSPGGSSSQLQYNNAGSFGGVTNSSVSATGNVGLGSAAPGQVLDVQGTVRTTGFTLSNNGAGAGYVMVGNGVGIGTWMAASTLPGTGTSPGGGQAAIQYNNASSFAGDATKFSFDGTNIGIGTAGPHNKLDILGNVGIGTNSNSRYLTTQAPNGGAIIEGNVGIGTWIPGAQLDVEGTGVAMFENSGGVQTNFISQGIAFDSSIDLYNGGNYGINLFGSQIAMTTDGSNTTVMSMGAFQPTAIQGYSDNGGSGFYPVLLQTFGGNVGIGTFNPFNKLNVNGGVGIGTSLTNGAYLGNLAPSGGLIVQGNVGIGTFNPFGGNLIVKGTGNVGIGSITPGQLLDVQGTARMTGFTLSNNGAAAGNIMVTNGVGVGTWMPASTLPISGGAGTNYWSLTAAPGNVGISTMNTVGIGTTSAGAGAGLVVMNGNVGIGTIAPGSALDVQGSVVLGYVNSSTDSITSSGLGSLAGGEALNNGGGTTGNIKASSAGSLAFGYARGESGQGNSNIFSNSQGSIALGYVDWGTIQATNSGSIAMGEADSGGTLQSTSTGSVAMGRVWNGNLLASNWGSIAMGMTNAGTIEATNWGSIAMGYSFQGIVQSSGLGSVAIGGTAGAGPSGILQATGNGSVAIGDAVQANATDAEAFGLNVINNTADTFMVGFNTTPTLTVTGTNVGIGTLNPFGGRLIVASGNVGIGSLTPGQVLDVTGTVRTTGFTMSGQTPVSGYVLTASDSAGDTTWTSAGVAGGWTVTGNNVYETSSGNVGIGTTLLTTSALSVMNGNVGIGTWVPAGQLDVEGTLSLAIFKGNVGIGTSVPSASLAVNGSSILGSSISSTDLITSTGTDSLAGGEAGGGGFAGIITSSSSGSLAFGNAFGSANSALLASTGFGSIALGNTNSGTIDSSSSGSVAIGDTTIGRLLSSNLGSVAMGYVFAGTLQATGQGSVAMGYGNGGTFQSSGSGSIALGYNSGTFQATQQGSVAIGDTVQANAQDAEAFGLNVINNTANTFMVGFNTNPTLTVTSTNVGIGTFNPFGGGLIVTNGNVGIGSLTPGQALDVQGTARMTGFILSNNGAVAGNVMVTNGVGVGTWMPASTLPISGGAGTNYWLNTAAAGNVGISTTNTVGIGTTSAGVGAGLVVMNGNVGIGTWAPQGALDIKTGGNVLVESGNVGIGSSAPGTALDVQGTVRLTGGIEGGIALTQSSTALALGIAPGGGTITSSGSGSIAVGNDQGGVNSSILSDGRGSIAAGQPGGAGFVVSIISSGEGSLAMGSTNGVASASTVTASGNGSLAMGFANNGTLQATGIASFAMGQNVQANANNDFALGTNVVNNIASTFMIGYSATPTLTVNSTTVGIGIGTYTTPSGALVVEGGNVGIGTFNPFGGGLIVTNGNVGIGSLGPGQALDVTGTVRTTNFTMSGQTPISGYVLTASDSAGDTTWTSAGTVSGWTVTGNNVYETSSGNVGIGTNLLTTAALTVMNGNVGIGTWVPSASLTVNGNSILGVAGSSTDLITTGGAGNLAGGFAEHGGSGTPVGVIETGNQGGSIALGQAQGFNGINASIISNGPASIAMGAVFEGTLQSSGSGSVAMGSASGGILQATAEGSVAMGENVQANTSNSFALGESVINNTTSTFMVGFNPTPTLTVTSTNVGIGTFNPFGGGLIVTNGNVGIGSLTPGQALDVQGTARMTGFTLSNNGAAAGNVMVTNGVGVGTWMPVSAIGGASISGLTTGTIPQAASPTSLANSVITQSSGNIGIGVGAPSAPLEVNGAIIADGSGNSSFSTGNLGVGTTTPQAAFVVTDGNVGIGTWTANSGLQVAQSFAVYRTGVAGSVSSAGQTIIGVTNTSAARTITLAAADTVVGRIVIIKDESGGAGTNNITVQPASGTIDGAASVVISVNYGVVRVYSDGTNWFTF